MRSTPKHLPALVSTLVVLGTFTLAGCESVPLLLAPHKIDVQQGNVINQDMVSKLKPGMTRQQVRFVLGSPPIVDPFRSDRWDYVYTFERKGRLTEQRRLSLFFKGDALERVEGDVVAEGGGDVPGAAKPGPATGSPREQTR